MDNVFMGGYTPDWYNGIIKNRQLIYEYNNTQVTEIRRRYEILKELLGECHEDTIIEPPFRCDEGPNLFIGRHFYANYNLTVLDYDKITIGNNVMFGPNVTLSSATHNVDWSIRNKDNGMDIEGAPIVIEDNVWLGANVVVMPGVTIGKHSVVAAGSVVTNDVPPDTIVAGVPAKVVKKLNSED